MSQESFLPSGYKEPVKSNYMDWADGSNRFRILAPATTGYEYWTRKTVDGVSKDVPTRATKEESIPLAEVITDKFGNLAVYFFWAFPVYNYVADKIQILQIKQKSVREGMQGFLVNKMWGSAMPFEYTFEVNKSKKADGKTEYKVIAEPKEPLDEAILNKFKSMNIDMKAWMSGEDPFNTKVEVTNEPKF